VERTGPIVQLAWWVDDLDLAAQQWARLGAGPFFWLSHIPLQRANLRGQAINFDHSSAYGWAGHCMVELVQVHSPGPSAFHELLPAPRPILHHVARFVPDLDRAVANFASLGHALAMDCHLKDGGRFCFIDTRSALGHYTELYEPTPALTGFYAMVEGAAQQWDGSDPIRPLSMS